jgi:hypothetical protein
MNTREENGDTKFIFSVLKFRRFFNVDTLGCQLSKRKGQFF